MADIEEIIGEINEKLRFGQAQRCIDPEHQKLEAESDYTISYVIIDGVIHLVRGRYDAWIHQIVPIQKKSLINWDTTYTIFNLGFQNIITPDIQNCYVDNEIDGKVSVDSFISIYESIDTFQSRKYHYALRRVPTDIGDQSALVREWIGDDGCLQLWISNSEPESSTDYNVDISWAIIYGTSEIFLIVGNVNDHPFVMTPEFRFDNSNGSTHEDIDFSSLGIDDIKQLLRMKSLEYVSLIGG